MLTEQWLRITPGVGVTHGGHDVTLVDVAEILLSNVNPVGTDNAARGCGVLVLEPIEVVDEVLRDDQDQCAWDPERDCLDDEQLIDACRLVFVRWPNAVLGPLPRPQSGLFRNRVAYQIFDYERAHPGEPLPWHSAGVPLALAYITGRGKLTVLDRYAVVRQGGAPPAVSTLLETNGTPFLWEARVQQLVDHLQDIRDVSRRLPTAGKFAEVLPPAGFLPKQAADLESMRTTFFPSQFIVDAVPIPEEQLEVALNAATGLEPIDLQKPERIKLLVPVPAAGSMSLPFR